MHVKGLLFDYYLLVVDDVIFLEIKVVEVSN